MALKVVIIGSFWPASLESSYLRAFQQLGADVTPIDFEALLRERYGNAMISRKLLWHLGAGRIAKDVIAHIQSIRPDLTFVIKGTHISPSFLSRIRSFSEQVVNFNPDSPWEKANSSRWLMQSVPLYDLHFTWSKRLLKEFKDAGVKHVKYLPFAYDPELHAPYDTQVKQFDAVFVGTYEPLRDRTLATLKGKNLAIWGNGWEQSSYVPKEWIKGSAIYGREACEAMSKGVVNINILRVQNAGSHNMRTFEIPATANLMLTTRSDEHQEFFTEDSDVLMYETFEELADKVKWALDNPEKVIQMGQRSRDTIASETYTKRAGQILEHCGLG